MSEPVSVHFVSTFSNSNKTEEDIDTDRIQEVRVSAYSGNHGFSAQLWLGHPEWYFLRFTNLAALRLWILRNVPIEAKLFWFEVEITHYALVEANLRNRE